MFEQQYAYYPTTMVEKIRNDVSLSALKALAIHLGGLREGRKSIIVLTEGYSDYVPPQLRDERAAGGGQLSAQRYDPFAGQARGEETAQFFEDSSMSMNLMYTADIANKNNTSLYMVDPRGLAVYEYDMSTVPIGYETDQRILRNLQDTLYLLAEQTDGRAIVNRNDVRPGLAQIVRDQSAYYLLGYTSSEAPTDGEFHEIEGQGGSGGCQRSRPPGLLRADRGQRGAGAGAAEAEAAQGGGYRAGDPGRTDPRPAGPDLGRHAAWRQRQDEGDVRLGAGRYQSESTWRIGVPGDADGHERQRGVFSRAGAGAGERLAAGGVRGRPGRARDQRRDRG